MYTRLVQTIHFLLSLAVCQGVPLGLSTQNTSQNMNTLSKSAKPLGKNNDYIVMIRMSGRGEVLEMLPVMNLFFSAQQRIQTQAKISAALTAGTVKGAQELKNLATQSPITTLKPKPATPTTMTLSTGDKQSVKNESTNANTTILAEKISAMTMRVRAIPKVTSTTMANSTVAATTGPSTPTPTPTSVPKIQSTGSVNNVTNATQTTQAINVTANTTVVPTNTTLNVTTTAAIPTEPPEYGEDYTTTPPPRLFTGEPGELAEAGEGMTTPPQPAGEPTEAP